MDRRYTPEVMDMRRRSELVCSALLLALITISVAPLLLKAQGQQPQAQGQQVQEQGQRQGQGQAGARGRGGRGQPTGPSKPTPRWPDSHPMLGALPGERGIW